LVGFAGQSTAGPSDASIFGQMGWIASNIVPLVLISVGLVSHALRERSAGYAFAAGLLANVSLMAGYALGIVTSGRRLDATESVWIVQLGTIGAAVWAIAWLASRRWVSAWRERPEAPLALPLMILQLAQAAVGSVVLLVLAAILIVANP